MVSYIGQQFGHYRLLRLLGTGGFAEVYLGEHVLLQTQAAIKVVLTQLSRQEEKFFYDEARTAARLIHPHIVRVLEFGVEGKLPYLVMDYAPNGTLRECYQRGSRLPLPLVVSQVKQIALALQYAHDEKLIHRDIKPENMLLGRYNEILLSDFGIAVVAHSSYSQRTQDVIGTVDYMAPEQIKAHPSIASDQYALAALTYEWLCGNPPFTGTNVEVLAGHLHAQPDPGPLRQANVPILIEQVILKALEKEPEKRFAKIIAFALALEQAAGLKSEEPIRYVTQTGILPIKPIPPAPPKPGSLLYLYRGHRDQVLTLAWRPDRRHIASAGVDSKIRIWNANTGKEYAIYKHPGYVVNVVVWSPNGRFLASAGDDGTVQVWDTHDTANIPYKSFSADSCAINALAWSPDGQYLVFGYNNGRIAIFNFDYDSFQTERRAPSSITSLAWSPDGNLLAYADVSGNLQICSVTLEENDALYSDEEDEAGAAYDSTKEVVYDDGYEEYDDEDAGDSGYTLQLENKLSYEYDDWINTLAWSPDSKRLVGGYEDGQVEIWDATDEEATQAIMHYPGHHDSIRTASWSANRKRIATGGDDATVHIWDAGSGRQVFVYQGHKDAVRCIAWSPDKKRVASASEDATVHIWSAP
jgi:eukaryotic-like serine/threonine-protein kinase